MVKNLKKLRNEFGISQHALAEKIGTSQQSINKYENHSVEPDITTLISLADFFNVSIDYLVGRYSDINSSDAEQLLVRQYKQLSRAEQTCIDTLIKTFNDTK